MRTALHILHITLALALATAPIARGADYDVVVYGSTPAGIALAVRTARDGGSVLLVGATPRLGGMLSDGIGAIDSLYAGSRAPFFDELIARIHGHYDATYGVGSPQSKITRATDTRVEPHIAEKILSEIVAREPRITVRREFYPEAVSREAALLGSVSFRAMRGSETFTVSATAFADCSYEGDLAQVAGAPGRIGREARAEYDEPHAGRIFVREVPFPPPDLDPEYVLQYRRLKITQQSRWTEVLDAPRSGEADPAVQAFSMRVVLSENPNNRIPIAEPPGYDREAFLARLKTDLAWHRGLPKEVPNGKRFMLQPEIIGRQNAYLSGTWEERRAVTEEHRAMTLRLLYFLQNDPSLPEATRRDWQRLGLPRDEFAETGHLPDQIYVRQGRRIIGREVFTEHHARLAPGLWRAPVVADSIGIAEWYLDSHACTPEKIPGSRWEGEFYLHNLTWPAQVPLGTIFPRGTDNLVVPVCLSATHVGFSTVRVEPVWMSLGEAAACALSEARRQGVPPAQVAPEALQRRLAGERFLLTFFNDLGPDPKISWYPAVQYFGTKGFFPTCDARPDAPLTAPLGEAWLRAALALRRGEAHDAMGFARRCRELEEADAAPLSRREFLRQLESATSPEMARADAARLAPVAGEGGLTRAGACEMLFHLPPAE